MKEMLPKQADDESYEVCSDLQQMMFLHNVESDIQASYVMSFPVPIKVKWLFNQDNCQHITTCCVRNKYVLKNDHFLQSSANVPKYIFNGNVRCIL